MKKKARNIAILIVILSVIFLMAIASVIFFIIKPFPQTIVASYDETLWQISYDPTRATQECQNQDPEFELFSENLVPQSDGRFILSKQPVKTICDLHGGIYDKLTNSIYTGISFFGENILVYNNDNIVLANWAFDKPGCCSFDSGSIPYTQSLSPETYKTYIKPEDRLIDPPFLYFKPISEFSVIGMEKFVPSLHFCGIYIICASTHRWQKLGPYISSPDRGSVWLAEYDIELIKDGDQVTDAIYTFTGRADKCLLTGEGCTFGGSITLNPDKIYFLRGCEPKVGQDCEDINFNFRTGSVELVKSQQFTESFQVSYTVPKEIISADLHYRKYSCPLLQNYMLVTETFSSNKIISKDSFRYSPNYFCLRHPIIVTDAITGQSYNQFDWYGDLTEGKSITCPAGSTCTFFYVVSDRLQLPIICKQGTYDATTGKCVSEPGLVHVCSEGQFDPALGLCVVQPDSSIICEIGRYDVSQAKCIWNPPEEVMCNVGEYDTNTGTCVWYPTGEEICPIGYEFNLEMNRCEYYPEITEICEQGYYDSTLNACIYNPDFRVVCLQGDYDEERNACVITPSLEYLCLNGYFNEALGVCIIIPIERIYCKEGFVYDQQSDMCIKSPFEEIRCPSNYEYDESRDVCYIVPETGVMCPDETTYDSVNNICVRTPSAEVICPSNYIYDSSKDICYISPETGITCADGTTYNSASNRCEYTPQIGVICPTGTIYDSMEDKCIIRPEEKIVCNDGYLYDFTFEACIKRPAIISWWYKFLEWLRKIF